MLLTKFAQVIKHKAGHNTATTIANDPLSSFCIYYNIILIIMDY